MKKVGIIMGSDSDMAVAEKAIKVLKSYEIPYEVHIMSAHRTPEEALLFAQTAKEKGFGVLISIAGMAAHLGGVLAAKTTLPVIGVPVMSGGLGGLDALLAMVQMPSGVPVATVAIGGGANAAHLSAQILALSDETLAKKVADNKEKMREEVVQKDKLLQEKLEQ